MNIYWHHGRIGVRRLSFVGLVAICLVATTNSQAQITVLATFNKTNGATPVGGVTLSSDGSTLYGTTAYGGVEDYGTVFSLPVGGGSPTTLASFNYLNGALPGQGLTLSGDGSTLYGTTYQGSIYGVGTVFSVPTGGGTPTTLGTFNNTDGAQPVGNLTLNGNTLYGATGTGGPGSNGTIYSLPVGGGTPATLATFNGTTNGLSPSGSLTLVGSTFYGTTQYSNGTVFSVPLGGGTPNTIASFNNTTNGKAPNGGLILIGNTFYGTAQSGGANNDGTVFSLPLGGGTPTALATFNGTNGSLPESGLILIGSTLYGETSTGGTYGYGTVFSVPVSGGTITDIANFDDLTTGGAPLDGLTMSADGSTLYGTTNAGGANNDGTVFSVAVPAPEPGSAALLVLGGVSLLRRRRRNCAVV